MMLVALRFARRLAVALVEEQVAKRAQRPTEWPNCERCGKKLGNKEFKHRQLTGLIGTVHWERREPYRSLPDNPENLFYFLVEITVNNCGGTDLTNVEVQDTFSNEAQPFETDDPGNVTIMPDPTIPGMVHESLTWDVDTIPAGESRTLHVKVGTEFNPSGRLEPTSAPQTIFYNGRNNDTGSASVGAMAISHGSQISCVDSEGEWDTIRFDWRNWQWVYHDKCTAITTSLPMTDSDRDGPTTSSAPSPLQRAAPVAAAAATVTVGLGSVAWWVLRRRLLGVLFP